MCDTATPVVQGSAAMDPVSLIVAALAAGAGAVGAGAAEGLTEAVKDAVADLYGRVKAAISGRAASIPGADRTLERHASDPAGYESPLRDLLEDSAADQDAA